jgi:hypothetical protein
MEICLIENQRSFKFINDVKEGGSRCAARGKDCFVANGPKYHANNEYIRNGEIDPIALVTVLS